VKEDAHLKRFRYLATLRYVRLYFHEAFSNMIQLQMLLNGQIEYGKVQFYFLKFTTNGPAGSETTIACALVSVYSRPVQALLIELSNTLWACQYMGVNNLWVVPLSSILTCVSIQPLPPLHDDPPGLWFVLEKLGLEDAQLAGFRESLGDKPGAGDSEEV